MRATAIWVKSQDGWDYIAVADPDHVIQICQSHSGARTEALRKAQAELATYGNGQTEITVGVAPGSLGSLIEGDEVNIDGAWREIEANTATLDDDAGQWTDVPQFGVVLDAPAERLDRTLKRGVTGMNGGTSHLTRQPATTPAPNVRP